MIGVFDSGIGGIAVVKRLRERFRDSDICYFGDTAHLPYGCRSQERIVTLSERALTFLTRKGCRTFLAACGTVSSVALPLLTEKHPGVRGILRPAVKQAKSLNPARVAVLGTRATVESHAFKTAVIKELPHAAVSEWACPLLVAMAEDGRYDRRDPAVRMMTRKILYPLRAFSPDCILLACTHFPYFTPVMKEIFPNTQFIDCGRCGADDFPAPENRENGQTLLYLTDISNSFRDSARRILGEEPSFLPAYENT